MMRSPTLAAAAMERKKAAKVAAAEKRAKRERQVVSKVATPSSRNWADRRTDQDTIQDTVTKYFGRLPADVLATEVEPYGSIWNLVAAYKDTSCARDDRHLLSRGWRQGRASGGFRQ